MSIEAALTFTLAIFVFAITPGPGTFALLARALVSGARSCFSMALGATFSDLIYLNLAIFGLANIAQNYSGLFTLIRFIGAMYLLYLGWKMWTTKVSANLDENKSKDKNNLSGFIQGFLISSSNPKVILFYIAFLPTFIDLTVLTAQDIILVSGLTVVGLLAGLMLVSYAAASIRQKLKSESAVNKLNRSAGSIMIGAGLFLVYRGVKA